MYTLHLTDAFVLDSYPRGETDKLYFFYTEQFGLVTIVAKGVRQEYSKMRGCLDLYMRTQIGFVAGKDMYRLTHTEARLSYPRLRSDFFRYRGAQAVGDLIVRLVGQHEGDNALWTLAAQTFAALASEALMPSQLGALLYGFQVKFFSILGYLPLERPAVVDMLYRVEDITHLGPLGAQQEEDIRLFLRGIYAYAGAAPQSMQAFLFS